jgi:hypothetical protein
MTKSHRCHVICCPCLFSKTGPARIGIKRLRDASRYGVPSRQGLAPSSTVKKLIALLRKSAARREMCIETRNGPSSGGAAWKNRFAAFYAAPSGAWRLRELDFYKHDTSTALTPLTMRLFNRAAPSFVLSRVISYHRHLRRAAKQARRDCR